MTDEPDFQKSIDPSNLDSLQNSISNAIDPEVKKLITASYDDAISKVIDPEMLKSIQITMDSAISQAIDPKLLEKMSFPTISDFSRQIGQEYIIQVSKSYNQLSYEEQQQFNERCLKLLEQIKDNTTNLSTIVDLIVQNNDKQEIVIQLLSQVFTLATAKNEEDLNDKFMKVVNQIKDCIELGELTGKLLYMAYTVFTLVSPLIGK